MPDTIAIVNKDNLHSNFARIYCSFFNADIMIRMFRSWTLYNSHV